MILCLCIPQFMASVERRAHPEWERAPLLFLRHSGKQERVYAVSPDADGVQPGMRVSQAQTLCPEGLLLPVVFHNSANALRELVEALREFSEQMEVKDDFHDDVIVYLDLGKLKPSDGLRLAEGVRDACADLHLEANLGIATGKFTALVAAQGGGIQIVRAGEEAAFLAPLPIAWLPLERAIERSLWQLGIERIGQLAAWSPSSAEAQFGKTGLSLLKLAQGKDHRPLRHYRLSNHERLLRTFDDSPLESRELVVLILNDLIHALVQRLERSAAVTDQLALVLHLEDSQSVEQTLQFRQALSGEAELQRVLSRSLEHLQIASRVTGVEIRCELRTADPPRQMTLFEYAEAQEREIDLKIKRLTQRFGSHSLLRALPNEPENPLPERRFRVEPLE